MNKAKTILLGASLLFLSACTQPGQTTMVSAAAGGVLGAGLGAIVGNQVGNAGAGVAIGAAGGAAAGAAIGNALEAQDKKLNAQDEVLKRREEAIQAQRTEITELRKMNQDTPSTGDAFAWNGNTDSSGVRHASPSEIAAARQKARGGLSATPGTINRYERTATAPVVHDSARAQMNTRTIVSPPAPAVVEAKSAPTSGRPAPALPSTSSVKERDLVQPPVQEIMADGSGKLAETSLSAQVEESAPPAMTDKATASLGSPADTSDCGSAKSEVKKAEQVSDTADKLFHLRRALRMCPSDADYHNKLGELYTHLGRKDDAAFEYNEALRINPSHAKAKENLNNQNRTAAPTSNTARGGTGNAISERY